MELLERIFDEVLVLRPDGRRDARGSMDVFFSQAALKRFVPDFQAAEQRVYSMPHCGTFFGIHVQPSQAKLISVIQGRGLDYVVDLRGDSPTYLRWNSMELRGAEPRLVYIPSGFGHAFLSLEDNTIELFSIDRPFENGIGNVIHYTDPSIRLALPQQPRYLSEYDLDAPFLK